MPEPDPIAELLEHLAERQWRRMTRSSTPWDDLNESDRRACRAIVKPILDDIAGHPAAEIEWAVVDRGRTIHIEGATCPADVLAGAHGHGATQVGVVRRRVWRTDWEPVGLSTTSVTDRYGSAAPTKEVLHG
ncbi:hypothetical protein [Pimelobacter simplex]|uniref:hypothetical protein n=1 Tax=Nocardioides simplex TaxID=2045 RepID=UPI0021505CEF|nr:hypothetical protein [Pimelobacter simplex]UUW88380.1 hypothetical protein M0M43_21910 [Pimelobacter simplex]UUW97884.1 hypothetical protein M0M48_10555 [Pimelobacter simplex]